MPEDVIYERSGAAAVVTIDRQERRNAIDGPTAALLTEAYRRFVADDDARVLVITGGGELAFCAGADLKAIESFAPRLELRGRPARLHAPDLAQARDRGDLGLVPRRRAGAGALVRPAHRHRGRQAGLHRAPLRRAADRRRHAAPAPHRRPRPRARHDPDRPHRRVRGGRADRPGHRGRAGRPTPRAGARDRRGARALPAGHDAGRPLRCARGRRAARSRRGCGWRRAPRSRRARPPGQAPRASRPARAAAEPARGPDGGRDRGHATCQVLRVGRGGARRVVRGAARARCSACSAPTGRARPRPSRSSRATATAPEARCGCSDTTPSGATATSRNASGSCCRAAASIRA